MADQAGPASQPTVDLVADTLRSVAAEFGAKSARISVEPDVQELGDSGDHADTHDTVIVLESETNPRCATMTVIVPETRRGEASEYVFIEVGTGSAAEVPIDDTWGPLGLPLKEEIRALAGAVVRGTLREKVTRRGDRVKHAEASFHADGRDILLAHSHGFVGEGHICTEVMIYEPYP